MAPEMDGLSQIPQHSQISQPVVVVVVVVVDGSSEGGTESVLFVGEPD